MADIDLDLSACTCRKDGNPRVCDQDTIRCNATLGANLYCKVCQKRHLGGPCQSTKPIYRVELSVELSSLRNVPGGSQVVGVILRDSRSLALAPSDLPSALRPELLAYWSSPVTSQGLVPMDHLPDLLRKLMPYFNT